MHLNDDCRECKHFYRKSIFNSPCNTCVPSNYEADGPLCAICGTLLRNKEGKVCGYQMADGAICCSIGCGEIYNENLEKEEKE